MGNYPLSSGSNPIRDAARGRASSLRLAPVESPCEEPRSGRDELIM
jgi:hypothetical protein